MSPSIGRIQVGLHRSFEYKICRSKHLPSEICSNLLVILLLSFLLLPLPPSSLSSPLSLPPPSLNAYYLESQVQSWSPPSLLSCSTLNPSSPSPLILSRATNLSSLFPTSAMQMLSQRHGRYVFFSSLATHPSLTPSTFRCAPKSPAFSSRGSVSRISAGVYGTSKT
jgi:hypothetical protein